MDFVVNEWLPEYFLPTAATNEKRQLEQFLNQFLQRNDRIIVKRPSPFLYKIYRYAKDYQENTEIVNLIRLFIKLILENSDKCIFVDIPEIPDLPDPITTLLSVGNFASDTYLFESATAISGEKTIVTTDVKLVNQFKEEAWCKVVLLSDFLENY